MTASRSAGANAPAFKGFSSKRPLSSKFNSSTNNLSTGSMLTSGAAAGTPTNGQKGVHFCLDLLVCSCLVVLFVGNGLVRMWFPKKNFNISNIVDHF